MPPVVIERIRFTFRSNVADEDVAWAIQAYHNKRQIEWCVPILREHYPTSRIVVISDGDDTDYSNIARRWNCELVGGDHLMTLYKGHLYVQRLLRSLLDGNEQYLFRIDPDVRVWRRLRMLPAFSCIFGTVETLSEGRRDEIRYPANVQGGCIGLTRDAAQEILDSGLLNAASCAQHCHDTWARCEDMRLTVSAGRISDDFVLSWAAAASGIPIAESPEIRSRWRLTPANVDDRYAITHPHKLTNETHRVNNTHL
jgi:hypothetical protein